MSGRPPGRDVIDWLEKGAARFRKGVIAALICGWSALWLALWIGAIAAVGGAIFGLVAAGKVIPLIGHTSSGGVLGAILGAGLGFALGFVAIYGTAVIAVFGNLVVAIASGVMFAGIVAVVSAYVEPWIIRLRGYRRWSRRERERIEPLLAGALAAMHYDGGPSIAIKDDPVPVAWAYSRHVVLTTGLLELEDDELCGILAHELHHWNSGTAVGLRFAWACALPLATMYNLGAWIAGSQPNMEGRGKVPGDLPGPREHMATVQAKTLATVIGWFLLWPSWLMIRYVVAPLMAIDSRADEYAADCAAADAGYADGLYRALEQTGTFEAGRTGWEGAMCATHPPIELRLEHLDEHIHGAG